jgi:two-component system invasion response regulator UvrY
MNRGGILFVSKSNDIFPLAKIYAKQFGYSNIKGTTLGKDALNRTINDYRPRLVFVEAVFYDTATPYMLSRLQKKIPELTLAVFSLGECPENIENRFLFFGIERYISLHHGMADFIHGFKAILDGKEYVAAKVRKRVDELEEFPEPSMRESEREDEVLIMLANGKQTKEIADLLDLSERTIAHHKTSIFSRYQVMNTAQLIRTAQNAGKIKLCGMYCLC